MLAMDTELPVISIDTTSPPPPAPWGSRRTETGINWDLIADALKQGQVAMLSWEHGDNERSLIHHHMNRRGLAVIVRWDKVDRLYRIWKNYTFRWEWGRKVRDDGRQE